MDIMVYLNLNDGTNLNFENRKSIEVFIKNQNKYN